MMIRIRPCVFLAIALVSFTALAGRTVAQPASSVTVRFVSITGVALEELAAGDIGEGWLFYYVPDMGGDKLKLAVHLVHEPASDGAWAYVYDVPAGQDQVPIVPEGNGWRLDEAAVPVLEMRALGGWWVRQGVANYDLDVQVNGPVVAMWGAGADPKFGQSGWAPAMQPGQPAVRVIVRDPDGDGIPDWDWRSLLPAFPNRGYYRTNYAEKKCDTPTEGDPGVSPLWPYVAWNGEYEQDNGRLRPPIVVDWQSGRLTHFSEMVTVRNQNCSYSLYTLDPVGVGGLNTTNFETPFAFYDLSGQGVGFPNLILRTERYPKGDRWAGRPERGYESVRYSWRGQAGDWLWDYKVEVLGFHTYDFQTAIAGGQILVDAPPYETFPAWVVQRAWPLATFIDTEGASYRSSEGIYDWSPLQVGKEYFLGHADNLAQPFSSIREGLRGEYRTGRDLPPSLYLSPIDNRLHLLGAEEGLSNLGGGLALRERNLDGDQYLDTWTLEGAAGEADGEGSTEGAVEVKEALYALDGLLIYSGAGRVELRQAGVEPSVLEVSPPTDSVTWQAFRDKVEPLTAQRKDPRSLAAWLDGFPGGSVQIDGAALDGVRALADGYRFVLRLQPGYRLSVPVPASLQGLAPGAYVVEFAGSYRVTPLLPPQLTLAIGLQEAVPSTFAPIPVRVTAANQGAADADGIVAVVQAEGSGETVDLLRKEVEVLAGEPLRLAADWQPKTAGKWTIIARLEDGAGETLASARQEVVVAGSPGAGQATGLLPASNWHGAVVLMLAIAAGCMALATSLALNRRRQAGR